MCATSPVPLLVPLITLHTVILLLWQLYSYYNSNTRIKPFYTRFTVKNEIGINPYYNKYIIIIVHRITNNNNVYSVGTKIFEIRRTQTAWYGYRFSSKYDYIDYNYEQYYFDYDLIALPITIKLVFELEIIKLWSSIRNLKVVFQLKYYIVSLPHTPRRLLIYYLI